MNRLDALTVRESNGKSFWTRIGVAFEAKDGNGWTVMLDAMPAPQDGQFKIMLRAPRQDGEAPKQAYSADKNKRSVPAFEAPDDDLPF